VQPGNSASKVGKVWCSIELISDEEGVDFNPYLQQIYFEVKKRWFANMPPSIEKGQEGRNIVEFHVLRDGNVPKDSVKMISSSEKTDFDTVSLETISDAAPFSHLPEKFSKLYIVVRFTFRYNLAPPKPQ
jgi:TonB family protein